MVAESGHLEYLAVQSEGCPKVPVKAANWYSAYAVLGFTTSRSSNNWVIALSGATLPAIPALTLTTGGVAYVLSSSQVAVAAASVAALAITKELLFKSAISRGRGRRDINSISQTPIQMEPFFELR